MKRKTLCQIKIKHLMIMFAILCLSSIQSSYGQQTPSKEVKEKLQQIYNKIKNPEIPFEKFAEINSHVYDKKAAGAASINAVAAAPQDTYCSKVRLLCTNGNFESG